VKKVLTSGFIVLNEQHKTIDNLLFNMQRPSETFYQTGTRYKVLHMQKFHAASSMFFCPYRVDSELQVGSTFFATYVRVKKERIHTPRERLFPFVEV